MSWNVKITATSKDAIVAFWKGAGRASSLYLPQGLADLLAAEVEKLKDQPGVRPFVSTEGYMHDGVGRGTFEIGYVLDLDKGSS